MHPLYSPVRVRAGTVQDAAAVGSIRNDAIQHTTAIWTSVLQTAEEASTWWSEIVDRGAGFVAEADGTVLGYACWAPWRAKEGYRFTVEDSVYVLPGHGGQGIGRLLMTTLIAAAGAAGAHVMLADIEAGNAASIALHRSLGFETVGTLREIGTKFDRWLDLVIMRRQLS